MTKANEIETAKVKQFSARIMEDYGNTLRGAMLTSATAWGCSRRSPMANG